IGFADDPVPAARARRSARGQERDGPIEDRPEERRHRSPLLRERGRRRGRRRFRLDGHPPGHPEALEGFDQRLLGLVPGAFRPGDAAVVVLPQRFDGDSRHAPPPYGTYVWTVYWTQRGGPFFPCL